MSMALADVQRQGEKTRLPRFTACANAAEWIEMVMLPANDDLSRIGDHMPLEILLSLFPLALTYPAWPFQQKSKPPLSQIRLILFRCGLLMSIVCSLTVVSSWFNPFPLLPDGQGGYSDIRNSMLFDTGLCTSFLTFGLAVFGGGRSRLLLAASGLALAFVEFAALLSNGV